MRYTITYDDPGLTPETVEFDTEAVAVRMRDDSTNDAANSNELAAAIEVIRLYEGGPGGPSKAQPIRDQESDDGLEGMRFCPFCRAHLT